MAAAMEHADMIWTGLPTATTNLLTGNFSFIDHIIDMLPLRPLVLSFSQALLKEANLEVEDYSKLFPHIVQTCGFETYIKTYKHDITPAMKCMENNPSDSCRVKLSEETNEFISSLVSSTRLIPESHEAHTDTGTDTDLSRCHEKSPHIFGVEGLSVINAVRIGQEEQKQKQKHSSPGLTNEEDQRDEGESSSPRIMCFTYSYDVKHEHVAAIRNTWGKRCDGYLAISNTSKEEDGIYALGKNRIRMHTI